LRFVAGKTGLTPNLLCRIGFCLSLGEPSIPNPADYPEEDREFNRYTLLGEYDALFVALLKQRCQQDGLDPSRIPDYFRAHMNRGIVLLQRRVKSISDIAELVPYPDVAHTRT
jgi:DNA sulfur modification protein DndE